MTEAEVLKPARFRPSDIAAWMACPGKVKAVESLPPEERDQESEAAREGTLGHEVIAAMLMEKPLPECPADLMPACQDCVIEVKKRTKAVEARGLAAVMHVETPVVIGEDCAGTADVVLLGKNQDFGTIQHIEVIDHKLGRGIWVSEEAMQLQAYLVGAMKTAMLAAPIAENARFYTTVIQPRHPLAEQHGVCRTQDWIWDEVETMEDNIAVALYSATLPNPPRVPGETQCRFCAFQPHCPELRQHSLQEMTQVFSNVQADTLQEPLYTRSPGELDDAQLSRIKEIMPLARSWLNAVDEYMREQALTGHSYEKWKLVHGRSSRAWVDEDAVRTQFAKTNRNKDHGGKRLRQDEYTEQKVISPTQAEKRIKPLLGKRAWAKLEQQISKSPGKPVLVHRSDEREEIITDSTKVFKPVETSEQKNETPVEEVSANPLNWSIFD